MGWRDRTLLVACAVGVVALALLLLSAEQRPAVDDPLLAAGPSASAELARRAAGLVYDDGYYYLVIARRLAAGEGSTFDGRHPTNGYHPLWLLSLLPLARLPPAALLLAVFALQTLLAAGAAAFLYRSARLLMQPAASGLAVLVWLVAQSAYWTLWSGMEYALHAFVVAALLDFDLRRRSRSAGGRRCAGALGLLASAAFLARLETLLLALLLAAVPRRDGRRLGRFFLLPLGATVLAYAAVNAAVFGHPLPLSAALKSAWSQQLLAADPVRLAHGWLAAKLALLAWPLLHLRRIFALPLLLALGGAAVILLRSALAIARRRTGEGGGLHPLTPAAAFAVAQVLAGVVLYHGGYSFQPWYFVVQPWLAAMVAGLAAGAVERRLRAAGWSRRRTVAVVLAAAALLALVVARNAALRRTRLADFPAEPLYAAAAWSRAQVGREETIGAWNAGMIAFFSGRRVINLDGLVNSREFYHRGRHDLCTYWRREGIDYLVDVFPPGDPLARVARQAAGCAGRLERIWSGPGGPGGEGAAAFRLRPRD
ncbi:MAG: hypothetical protein D6696_20610 [Acidobacteria bacterium]|nr:MAG: hypothetical protein D6696_20610 [Acidobacteriota bacterium]